ncbi:uncharacterized protein LOC130645643 [Hydractinia symbiolongicarpus]|uniref:uncharacterized protein LOC130645643 n=1 Tax=Hydractinia symbiolongicarpus TaxID=13093 RepID=UPI0025505D6C|nr:uncharacterized protein LOC130645643 [Hydractinia symbiolongicarpus]
MCYFYILSPVKLQPFFITLCSKFLGVWIVLLIVLSLFKIFFLECAYKYYEYQDDIEDAVNEAFKINDDYNDEVDNVNDENDEDADDDKDDDDDGADVIDDQVVQDFRTWQLQCHRTHNCKTGISIQRYNYDLWCSICSKSEYKKRFRTTKAPSVTAQKRRRRCSSSHIWVGMNCEKIEKQIRNKRNDVYIK